MDFEINELNEITEKNKAECRCESVLFYQKYKKQVNKLILLFPKKLEETSKLSSFERQEIIKKGIEEARREAAQQDINQLDAKLRYSKQLDRSKYDAAQRDKKQQDSKQQDSKQQDSKQPDSKQQDSKQLDGPPRYTTQWDPERLEALERDSIRREAALHTALSITTPRDSEHGTIYDLDISLRDSDSMFSVISTRSRHSQKTSMGKVDSVLDALTSDEKIQHELKQAEHNKFEAFLDDLMSDKEKMLKYLQKLCGDDDFDLDALLEDKNLLRKFIMSKKQRRKLHRQKLMDDRFKKLAEITVDDLVIEEEEYSKYYLEAQKEELMSVFDVTQEKKEELVELLNLVDKEKKDLVSPIRKVDPMEKQEQDMLKYFRLKQLASKIKFGRSDRYNIVSVVPGTILTRAERLFLEKIQSLKEFLDAGIAPDRSLIEARALNIQNEYKMSQDEWDKQQSQLFQKNKYIGRRLSKIAQLQFTYKDEIFFLQQLYNLKMALMFDEIEAVEEEEEEKEKPSDSSWYRIKRKSSFGSRFSDDFFISPEQSSVDDFSVQGEEQQFNVEIEEPEFPPYEDNLSLSQRKALLYLEKHKIEDLFRFLGSHLVVDSPADPIQFLINLLDKCLDCRLNDSKCFIPAPLLFERKHIESLYFAMDPLEIGFIRIDQYITGMQTLGIQKFNEELVLDQITLMVRKDEFINDAYERMLLQFNEMMQASAISSSYKKPYPTPAPSLKSWSIKEDSRSYG